MPVGFEVRAAVVSDAEAVWPLTLAFATTFVPDKAAHSRVFADLVESSEALVLLAEHPDAGRAVGYLVAHVHPALFANGLVAWTEELMVDEPYRRMGCGSLLVGVCEEWAADRGAHYIALATRRAAAFYGSLGYVQSAAFLRKRLSGGAEGREP